MKVRSLIGIIHLVNTILFVSAIFTTKNVSASDSSPHWLICAIMVTWLMSTLVVKISMAIGEQLPSSNFIAVVSFLILIICLEKFGGSSSGTPWSTLTLITGILFFFGGFITDIVDFIYCWPFKKRLAAY